MAQRFSKPSTAPIARSVNSAQKSIRSAKSKTAEIQKVAEKDCPELKLQIVDLQTYLDSALYSLSESDKETKRLDAVLKKQTDAANKVVEKYNTEVPALKESRHRWVKFCTYAALLASLEAAWIFRKPLLLLIAGL